MKIIKYYLRKIFVFVPERYKSIFESLLTLTNKDQILPPHAYPMSSTFKSYLNEPLSFSNSENLFFTQIFGEGSQKTMNSMVEIVPGRMVNYSEEFVVNVQELSVIPISFYLGDTIYKINHEGNENQLSGFLPNKFYYLKVKPSEALLVKKGNKLIIGNSISLCNNSKRNVKLVLCFFVDGLSSFCDGGVKLKKLMPNTYSFFSQGVIFNNCHSNADWTLPSVATFFTGLYTHHHNVFHPRKKIEIGANTKILSEFYKQNDYLTFQIGGNWRKSPAYGYIKGFDRTIYKRDASCSDIIPNLFDQLIAFNTRDQFVWVDIFDLHQDEAPHVPPICCQTQYSDMAHSYDNLDGKKSVFKNYDIRKIERYHHNISRLDKHLKNIYNYIEDNYANDEIIIMLCSDHGQAYLSSENHPLSDSRAKVAFMIRGKGIPNNIQSNELIENVDIFPTMLKLSGIEFDNTTISGRLPKDLGGDSERQFVFSESIFPDQTYKAVIRDSKYAYYFETEYPVSEEGKIKLGSYKTTLFSQETNQKVIEEYYLMEKYEECIKKKIEYLLVE